MELSPAELRLLKSRFTMSLANLQLIRVFWLPGARRITARSVHGPKPRALPGDAVLVGLYEAPCKVGAFVEDLEAAIAK